MLAYAQGFPEASGEAGGDVATAARVLRPSGVTVNVAQPGVLVAAASSRRHTEPIQPAGRAPVRHRDFP